MVPAVQEMPQVPQWLASPDDKLVHTPLQQPGALNELPQDVPQVPQLFTSIVRSAQYEPEQAL